MEPSEHVAVFQLPSSHSCIVARLYMWLSIWVNSPPQYEQSVLSGIRTSDCGTAKSQSFGQERQGFGQTPASLEGVRLLLVVLIPLILELSLVSTFAIIPGRLANSISTICPNLEIVFSAEKKA